MELPIKTSCIAIYKYKYIFFFIKRIELVIMYIHMYEYRNVIYRDLIKLCSS